MSPEWELAAKLHLLMLIVFNQNPNLKWPAILKKINQVFICINWYLNKISKLAIKMFRGVQNEDSFVFLSTPKISHN